MQVEAPEPEQHTTASGTATVNVGMSAEKQHEADVVELRWARFADVPLRIPMYCILLFFWFAFHVLGSDFLHVVQDLHVHVYVLLTAFYVLLNISGVLLCLFSINYFLTYL